MIVVDTNVIGYLFLSSERSFQAERALQNDIEWAAPLLWRSELCSVLVMYLRKNLIKLEHALHMILSSSLPQMI
jgi:predicted nucleic acid-binding protein